ncbi:MAG: FdhF/YdeP family oxidoreductase [Bacteroidetes bacterium]|nr:FdhF/YdeP family oxidoreductase [Bacteroidota bacterium]
MKTGQENNEEVNAENPERFTGLKLIRPKTVAAGIPAIFSSARHIFSEMGPGRNESSFALNQKSGFDCPGCAWPDPDIERSSLGEYCENGVKAIAEEATTKKLNADYFRKNSIASLSHLNDYEIGKAGRVAEPMYLPKGGTHYEPITWENAFSLIAKRLHECKNPNDAVFYTSGRTSNEAAFLYQLFVRQFGTNNLPDCSNMCHESSGVALTESLGIGKGSVTLDDFYNAEVIIILGQNPGTNHPRMLTALQKAKENGCTIISVNPLPETGLIAFNDPQSIKGALGIKARLTDIFLQVKINGDMALLQAIEKLLLIEEEKNPGSVFDHEFINEKTNGSKEFIQHLKNLDLNSLIAASGISKEQILEVANIFKTKSKIIACWAMGLTQHQNAVDTIKEVVNLLLLKGSIGKPGAGTCPVRGHSNVQGDRTMGIYEKPSPSFLDAIQKTYSFNPPREHGYDVVDCIHAMHKGKVNVFMAMGGNFLSATPDTTYTAEALRKCKLTIQVSTKLNRSHLITGEEALILPVLGRSDKDVLNGEEQFITTENSMGVIQMSKGNLTPVSDQLLSEPALVCKLALAYFGDQSTVRWEKYLEHNDHIRNDIAKTISGFDNYNTRVRKLGGFYLPNSAREQKFTVPSGKAEFNIGKVKKFNLQPNEYVMMTIRSHDQFNTTIYGLNDRYRGVINERRVIFMNEKDIAAGGFTKGEVVDLYNFDNNIERVAHRFIIIPFSIPEKCTATYFPETNVLVPIDSTAEKSNTPTSKSVIIEIRRSATS